MDSKQRRNISWSGSVLFHILIVLVIAFTGILHSQQLKENIVEIAFVGGGGGGSQEKGRRPDRSRGRVKIGLLFGFV